MIKMAWDSGIDFEKERERLKQCFLSTDNQNELIKTHKEIKDAIFSISSNNGVKIAETRKAYNEFLKVELKTIKENKFLKLNRKIKIAILSIAINNGARIGEARTAYNMFIKTGNRELELPVEKRGYTRKYKKDTNGNYIFENGKRVIESRDYKPVFRKIIIPSYISFEEQNKNRLLYTATDENLCDFSRRYFNYNPHSLRYAFITYMGVKEGKSAQLIAKITKHAGLGQIIGYTQQKEADMALKDVVD